MRADWAAPVSAVLNHFDVEEATLVGMSLGGGLVMRAAAGEPRARRVVAFDVLDDFLEVLVSQSLPPTLARGAGRSLTHLNPLIARTPTRVLNRALTEQARGSPVTWWGMWQGMHVTGTHSPAEFLRAAAAFSTADVSPRVTGDVLLMQGAEDEFVPLHQMVRQAEHLTAARSVTTQHLHQGRERSEPLPDRQHRSHGPHDPGLGGRSVKHLREIARRTSQARSSSRQRRTSWIGN